MPQEGPKGEIWGDTRKPYLSGAIQNLRSGKLTTTARRVLTTEAIVPASSAPMSHVLSQKAVTWPGRIRFTTTMTTARTAYYGADFEKSAVDLKTNFIWTKKFTTCASTSAIRKVMNPPRPWEPGVV